MRILVVVPALNEERSVGPLVADIRAEGAKLGVEVAAVVIDDGSTDHTAAVAEAAGARVVQLPKNLGIGGAVQTGLRLAWREGFSCAVQIDGDGQHPPSELGKLIPLLNETPPPDLIIGTRYGEDRQGFQSTLLRRLGSGWLRWVLRTVAGVRSTDPTSGYRVYGPRALALFERTYPYDYPEPESLAMARAAGLSIREVPVVMRPRVAGSSSIRSWRTAYYMLKVSVAVALCYVRSARRPWPKAM
ncbi:MAG TPA: glycosyltransferase family 2 protein [Polyangia bacterium]|nr:glycosyltransferase family 2 protein [Polyangia bacterium]